MPFRTFRAHIPAGEAARIYTAQAGDVHVHIHSVALPGQQQAAAVYNFAVGGPELEHDQSTALYCSNGEWHNDVDDGDEVWAAIPDQQATWTEQPVALTVMVFSRRARKPPASQRTGQRASGRNT